MTSKIRNKEHNTLIDQSLTIEHSKVIKENRHYIKTLSNVLNLTARQNISQRGHREEIYSKNRGNFIEILEVIATVDTIVEKRLNRLGRAKYISPQIQADHLSISPLSYNKIFVV